MPYYGFDLAVGGFDLAVGETQSNLKATSKVKEIFRQDRLLRPPRVDAGRAAVQARL